MKKTLLKKLFLLLPFLVSCTPDTAAPRSEVQLLIDIYSHYDYVCCDIPGTSDEAQVCKIRDDVGNELNRNGWCNKGLKDDSARHQFIWKKCTN